jgi:hypothetical protein
MRKLILISAFVFAASVSAQASQSRGLILASNDDPVASAKVEANQPASASAEPAKAEPAKAETPKAETKTPAAKPSKKAHAHSWRDDEAKARRIAAKYGVYW